MTKAERLILEALSLCRLPPGTWAKRFVRDLCGRDARADLTPKQRRALWSVAERYRKQLANKQRPFGEMLEAHARAMAEGGDLPGERGRFELALSFDPADWDTRLVYADWLEEQGDAVGAAGQRWQASLRKHPVLTNCGESYGPAATLPINWKWRWWMVYPDGRHEGVSVLPCELWVPAKITWSESRIDAERKVALRLAEVGPRGGEGGR